MDWRSFEQTLGDLEARGGSVRLWWRDDDAVDATPQLDRLIDMANRHQVSVLLAVIPQGANRGLAERVAGERVIVPAVHGFAHVNHAGQGEKKQELGIHRPSDAVVEELARGRNMLADLFGSGLADVLVPPWNRIAGDVSARLPETGFHGLSCFGPEERTAGGPGLLIHNCHLDPIEWHGSRSLISEQALLATMNRLFESPTDDRERAPVGLLTHHLIHDDVVWDFVEGFLDRTRSSPACMWLDPRDLFGG